MLKQSITLLVTLTVCLLLLPGAIFASSKTKLEWSTIAGIKKYDIQVRNKLTASIETYTTADDHIWVELGFGVYEMKIVAFDYKGRPVSETAWILMTVMRTYQPQLDEVILSKIDRSQLTLYGESFFAKTDVVIRSTTGSVFSSISDREYPSKIIIRSNLDKNKKYYISVQNPGDYSISKLAHVFDDDDVMLFDDEYQYDRYFSKIFMQAGAAWQLLHNNYDFSSDWKKNYWSKAYQPGVTSFNLLAGYHLVSWFGFIGGLEYEHFKTNQTAGGELDVTTHYIIPQVGLFFSYKHKNFVPYISSSIGAAFSYLDVTAKASNAAYNSTDLYFNYGAGCKIFFFRHFYLNPAIYSSKIDLKGTALEAVNARLGIGYYF